MVKITVVFSYLSHEDNWITQEQEADYEHGLMLLLNASDLEMPVEALFLLDVSKPYHFNDSLFKKFRQLELFDISTSAYCTDNVSKSFWETFNNNLPFVNNISYLEFSEKLSKSEHVIWI